MAFCPKCGTKLNDGDLFCHNCGAHVDFVKPQQEEKYYGDIDNFPTKKAPSSPVDNSNRANPLAKAGLIISIISISLMVIFFISLGFDFGEESRDLAVIAVASLLFGMIGCSAALGLSIPGLILTKKRGYSKGVAIAALVLSIICVILFLACYVYIDYMTISAN